MKKCTIKVDVRNPGQFFACCGILYCADRMFENAECCFNGDEFTIRAECDVNPINAVIKRLNQTPTSDAVRPDTDSSDSPLYVDSIPIRFDFYNHIDNRHKIKLFAGREEFATIISRWLDHLQEYDVTDTTNLQDFARFDVPSGLDTSTSWNALDVGFSLNEQDMERRSYPLTEFFAHVGIQTYAWTASKAAYTYRTWPVFLPITVARAVSAGILQLQNTRRFRFYAKKTGQKQIFKTAREIDNFHDYD